jgi:hypothetical protein
MECCQVNVWLEAQEGDAELLQVRLPAHYAGEQCMPMAAALLAIAFVVSGRVMSQCSTVIG